MATSQQFTLSNSSATELASCASEPALKVVIQVASGYISNQIDVYLGGSSVYLGGSSVTTGTGFQLSDSTQQSFPLALTLQPGDSIYAISSVSGGPIVQVLTWEDR